jgi:hypothetical protein
VKASRLEDAEVNQALRGALWCLAAVRWHDLATGREWHRLAVPPGASLQGLCVSPDGLYAADGIWRGLVYLFRLEGREGPHQDKQQKEAQAAQSR